MANFWKGKNVLVTGGTGFIGSYVSEQLLKKGSVVSVTTHSKNLENIKHLRSGVKVIKADLTTLEDSIKATKGQEIVLNLAAKVAGVQYKIDHPATMFLGNFEIAKNILEASLKNKVERVLITSSPTIYSKEAEIPTKEEDGFLGEPDHVNRGYGWGKRASEILARFYFEEYGLKVAITRPYNTYGSRDHFDPAISHVIPGIIYRVFHGENPLVVWGSGKQTRAFIYAEDFARGLIEVTEKYAVADPINIGTDEEISIGDLAKLIVDISGKKVKIHFDTSKPDGILRSNCDTSKAKKKLGFVSKISLREGLEKTIAWYKKNQKSLS